MSNMGIYETYRLIQGKCFYFEWKYKNFKDAKENCKQKGGKLYEPMDAVVMKEIAKISGIGPSYTNIWAWIGITDTAKEGNYVYESNSQSIKFSPPWAPLGYGAQGISFNCIGLQVNGNSYRGTLADLKCSAYHSMYSICEL